MTTTFTEIRHAGDPVSYEAAKMGWYDCEWDHVSAYWIVANAALCCKRCGRRRFSAEI